MITIKDNTLKIDFNKTNVITFLKSSYYTMFFLILIPFSLYSSMFIIELFTFIITNMFDLVFNNFWNRDITDKFFIMIVLIFNFYHIGCSFNIKPFHENMITGNYKFNIIYTFFTIVFLSSLNACSYLDNPIPAESGCSILMGISFVCLFIYNLIVVVFYILDKFFDV